MPPKNDAFADLFKSANTSSKGGKDDSNLSLLERQQRQANTNQPERKGNTWDDLQFLSGNSTGSQASSGNTKPSAADATDPFDIFVSSSKSETPVEDRTAAPRSSEKPSSTQSLLDDDFIDVFEGSSGQNDAGYQAINSGPLGGDEETGVLGSTTWSQDPAPNSGTKHSEKDRVLAELVDIGFSVQQSNEAIDRVGNNLQSCVNYIMDSSRKASSSRNSQKALPSKGAGRQTTPGAYDFNHLQNEFSSKVNNFSSEFFTKASFFLNKSKETIKKNIEQFQDQYNLENEEGDRLPQWMKEQSSYKKEALERRNKGEYEDYGSDEENIDVEAISKFLKAQKLKDQEKRQERLQDLKNSTRLMMSGKKLKETETNADIALKPNSSDNNKSREEPIPETVQPQVPKKTEPDTIDLLNIGGGSANGLHKNESTSSMGSNVPHTFLTTSLNQFEESDYSTAKDEATEFYKKGDYDNAVVSYEKSLNALPEKHCLKIVIYSNLALTLMKASNYKRSLESCNEGLTLVTLKDILDTKFVLSSQSLKLWYVKLLSRKAESLEMLENFKQALDCYQELVSQLGVTDKKTLDAKRRVANILNPPKPKRTPVVPDKVERKPKSSSADNENVQRVKSYNQESQKQEELKFKLHDQIEEKIFQWCNGKEGNIRTLLIALPDIIPERLNFPFVTTKKITLNDLMLPKKVKINYMKVISSIHPDKLNSMSLEDKLICERVFIILNKAWDKFKEENGMS